MDSIGSVLIQAGASIANWRGSLLGSIEFKSF